MFSITGVRQGAASELSLYPILNFAAGEIVMCLKFSLICVCVLFVVSAGAKSDPEIGVDSTVESVACVETVQIGRCYLTWSLPAQPNATAVVERFETSSQSWEPVQIDLLQDRSGTKDSVSGGGLYRASSCGSNKNQSVCNRSKAVWVPVLPDSVNDIPDKVVANNGGTMLITKPDSLASQTLIYNIYLMAKLLSDTDDVTKLPAMEPRRLEYLHGLPSGYRPTIVEEIEWHNYGEYESQRTNCIQSSDGCPFSMDSKVPAN